MKIDLCIQIDYSANADTSCFDNNDFIEGMDAWDITPDHSKTDFYFETESISINHDPLYKRYILKWLTSSKDAVPNSEIGAIFDGAISILNILEESLNYIYHHVSTQIFYPNFALQVLDVSVDGKVHDLDQFSDFNKSNLNLQEKFDMNDQSE